jgi:hypothetical protein
MFNGKTFWRMAGLTLAMAAVLVIAQGALAAGDTAKVTRIQGDVTVQYGKGAVKKVNKGMDLKAGALIKTGKKGRLEIRLADNSVLRLGYQSTLTLEQAMFAGEAKNVSAKLVGGKAYALVNKLTGDDSSFQIKTRTAVAGVRGTAFRIDANRDKSTVVRVYTGAVAVSNAPIYAKAGKPKADGKFQMPRQGVKPGGPGRVEIAGPQEVTKKQWEELVAQAMQEISVSPTGKLSSAVAFDADKDLEDEWVAWNKTLDKQVVQ